ncbi:MAG: hemerythrin domain-containing protein [Myxococcales bacterium]|nr:hemerythrin domain-containing protein [Myxococcales bacterium]
MHPTQRLIEEHQTILRAMGVLERIAEAYGEDPGGTLDDARAMVEFLRGFAEELHHAKEEAFLFPAMEEAGHSRHAGPIGVMLMEHDDGRGLIAEMLNAFEDPAAGADTFEAAALSFAEMIRNHILKEDEILFPLAEETLSDHVRARLVERMAHHDEVLHGKEYQRQLAVLAELALEYPVARSTDGRPASPT